MILKKMIACSIFRPYLERLSDLYPADLEIEYLPISKHESPQELHRELQDRIDQNQQSQEILLAYTLCGNALQHLVSPHVKMRYIQAHDCLAVLYGSQKAYALIQSWFCEGNYRAFEEAKAQRQQEWSERYGEENAQYLLDLLYPEEETLAYLSFDSSVDKEIIARLRKGKAVEIYSGSLDVLLALLLDRSHPLVAEVGDGQEIQIPYSIEKENA